MTEFPRRTLDKRVVTLRLSHAQHAQLQENAHQARMSMNAFCLHQLGLDGCDSDPHKQVATHSDEPAQPEPGPPPAVPAPPEPSQAADTQEGGETTEPPSPWGSP